MGRPSPTRRPPGGGYGRGLQNKEVSCEIGQICLVGPVSSRLITIRLKASLFNITIIQAYAPTTEYDDDDIEDFYDHLQEVIDQAIRKDTFVLQSDWNAKIGEDASKNRKGTCGQYCNPETKESGLRLLEFAS